MTLALRHPFQQLLLLSMAAAVALCCLFLFAPRAQASQLSEAQIEAVRAVMVAYDADLEAIDTVNSILQAPRDHAAEQEFAGEGEVLGASTVAAGGQASAAKISGPSAASLEGLPGAFYVAGIEQEDVPEGASAVSVTPTVSEAAPASEAPLRNSASSPAYVALYRYEKDFDHADYAAESKSGWTKGAALGYLSPAAGDGLVALRQCAYTVTGLGTDHLSAVGSTCPPPNNPAITLSDEGVIGYVWTAEASSRIGIYSCLRQEGYGVDLFSSRSSACEGAGVPQNGGSPLFYLSKVAVPPADISIEATPDTVPLNSASTIVWSGQNVASCAVTKGTEVFATGLSGSKTTGPLVATSTYKLACAKLDTGTTTAATQVTVVANPDKTKPKISFTSPANNQKVKGSVYISVNAEDPKSPGSQSTSGLSKVSFLVNNEVKSEDASAPYAYIWNSNAIATGTYAIKAVARDKAGNETSVTRSVTVQHVPSPLAYVALNRFLYNFEYFGNHMDLPFESYSGYKKEGRLGYLATSQGPGMIPIYQCIHNYNSEYNLRETFTSRESDCEGKQKAGMMGYVWRNPAADRVAIYRCYRTHTEDFGWGPYHVYVTFADHYSSHSATCEGHGTSSGNPQFYLSKIANPAPVASLTATPAFVESGSAAVISWSVANASNCAIKKGDEIFASGSAGVKTTGPLSAKAVYRLSCDKLGGGTFSTSTVVSVRPAGDALVTARATDPLASEKGGGTGQYLIRRVGSTIAPLAVTFTVGGSATRNADYRLSGGGVAGATGTTITIPAGATSTSVLLTPLQDSVVEGTEAVTLTVVKGAGYATGVPNAQSVSISDDETPVPATVELRVFAHTGYSDDEPYVEYVVGIAGSLPGGYWTDVSSLGYIASEPGAGRVELVSCGVVDGFVFPFLPQTISSIYTGVGSCSYGHTNIGSLGYVWQTADASRQAIYFSECAPYLILSASQYYSCNGYINEPAFYTQIEKVVQVPTTVRVTATVPKASEAGTTGAFAVTRTGTDLSALSVTLSVSGTATRNKDYTLTGGGLTAKGKTVLIPKDATQVVLTLTSVDDTVVEGSETVILSIASTAKYAASATASSSTVSITDNDKVAAPTVTLTAAPASIASGKSAQLTWNATSVTSCTGKGFSAAGTSGSVTVKPTKTTKYSIICVTAGSTAKATASTTVTVTAALGASAAANLLASVAMAPFSIATDALTDIFVMFGVGQPQPAAVAASRSSATTNTSPILSFSVDPKSPSYSLAAGGSTGVVLGRYKVHASGDSISLLKLELKLDSGAPSDLTQVYLYNGTLLVGTAVFTNSTSATVVLTAPMTVPADSDVVLHLQGDISPIGISKPGKAGSLIVVNTANYTAVSSSGTTFSGSAASSNGSVAGVRMYRSFPIITMSASTPCVGPACRGANVTLGRFEIAANPAGGIGIRTISASVVAQFAEVDNARLYAYSQSGFGGQVGSSCDRPDKVPCSFVASPELEIPAGMTYSFILRGDVIPAPSAEMWSASTVLLGDASLRVLSVPNATDYFSWSPNDITISGVNDPDWTNGFMLPNLQIVKAVATGPSISGIDAPTALKVGQTGTWKVNVTNPGSKLSYSVVWGDESTNINSKAQSPSQTSATFTHTYAKAGTYNPLFTVKNSNGYSQAGAQVVVGAEKPSITVTVPNGGEKWEEGVLNTVTWTPYQYSPDINPAKDVTAYLEIKNPNGTFSTLGKVEESGKASIHWITGQLNSTTQSSDFVTPGSGYYIRVVNNVTGASDRSNASFTILPTATDLKVNGSDGPVNLAPDQQVYVSWASSSLSCWISGLHTSPKSTKSSMTDLPSRGGESEAYYTGFGNIVLNCQQTGGKETSDVVAVNAPATTSLKITSPNGGESIALGQTYTVGFSLAGIKNVSIALYKNDKWQSWIVKDMFIGDSKPGEMGYLWKTPTEAQLNSNVYKIYITGQRADGKGYIDDKSDNTFKFIPAVLSPKVTLTASPVIITKDKSSVLVWEASNAASCTGKGFSAAGTSGSTTVKPAKTTKYSITCSAADAAALSTTASVTVKVVSGR